MASIIAFVPWQDWKFLSFDISRTKRVINAFLYMASPHRQHAPVTAFSPTLARYRREDATKLQNIYENQNENEKFFDSPPYESQGAWARNKKAVSRGLTAGHQRLAAVQEPAVLCAHRTPRSNEKNKRYHQRVMVAQPMCVGCYNLSALVAITSVHWLL